MENERVDSASKLIQLINKILETSSVVGDLHGNAIGKLPFHSVVDKIASTVGKKDYLELIASFLKLCEGIKDEIGVLGLTRESVRSSWLEQVDLISRAFSQQNLSAVTLEVFNNHFNSLQLSVLDMISERLQNDQIFHTDLVGLKDAFETLKSASDAFDKSAEIEKRVKNIIKVHVNHLKDIVETYEDFGEADFWDRYRVLFATFSQILGKISDEKERDSLTEKTKAVWDRILLHSTLGSNLVTIGTPIVPVLLSALPR